MSIPPADTPQANPFQSPSADVVAPPISQEFMLSGLRKTRTGLMLVYYGIALILLVGIIAIFGVVFSVLVDGGGRGVQQQSPVMTGLILICYGIAFVASILMFIGQCLCISVPADSGAKAPVAASILLQVLSFVISLATILFLISMMTNNGPVGRNDSPENFWLVLMMGAANALFGVAAFFCFLLFFKKLGAYIHREDISKLASKTIGILSVIVIFYSMMMIGMFAMNSAIQPQGRGARPPDGTEVLPLIMMAGSLFVLVGSIVMLCMYTTLIRKTINALAGPNDKKV